MPASRSSASRSLPPLAFGERTAEQYTDVNTFGSALGAGRPVLGNARALGESAAFRARWFPMKLQDLHLMAASCTPVGADLGAMGDTTLLIPFHGQPCLSHEGNNYFGKTGRSAMLLPDQCGIENLEKSSSLMVDVDRRRLGDTAASMLGESTGLSLGQPLSQPRELALKHGPLSFDLVLRRLCGLIDVYHQNLQSLAMLALDDLFYRTLVMMMEPARFLKEATPMARRNEHGPVSRVCEFILANIDRPIALSELERVSGLSARGLQYAFQKRHGCSPMQWLRIQRLERARDRLVARAEGDSVTTVALDCGFSQLGEFARIYARRFGELPSETLRRASKR